MAMRATKIQSVKADAIGELKNKIGAAKDFIFAEYRGLTVEQISALRKQLREKNAEFHVVKNNFARIAFEDLGYTKEVEPVLAGPTAVAFSRSEANEVAKVLVDFAKETPALKVKAGIVDKGIHGRGRDRGLLEAPFQEPAHRDVHGGPSRAPCRSSSTPSSPCRKRWDGSRGGPERPPRRAAADAAPAEAPAAPRPRRLKRHQRHSGFGVAAVPVCLDRAPGAQSTPPVWAGKCYIREKIIWQQRPKNRFSTRSPR